LTLGSEKLLNFVRTADTYPDCARELPNVVAEIKRIFEPSEIRVYLDNVHRVGAEGHACTNEESSPFLVESLHGS
jgi:hypothetical protein